MLRRYNPFRKNRKIFMDIDLSFKKFMETSDHFMTDVKETMLKIPKSHAKLIKGYKFASEKGNTLSGDKQHVGEIDEKTKKIKVAAPWNYSREMVICHEIAHAVWKYKMTSELKSKWSELIAQTKQQHKIKQTEQDKKALQQNVEELFCMAYATTYCTHAPSTFNNEQWIKFIKNECPS